MECRSCFVCAMNCSGGSGWSCIYTRPVWAARDNCCATRMDPHATADANTSISYRGSADALGKEHAHSVTARIYQCDIDMRPLRCPRAERTSRKALAREQAGRWFHSDTLHVTESPHARAGGSLQRGRSVAEVSGFQLCFYPPPHAS
jgi:hypothetical protein